MYRKSVPSEGKKRQKTYQRKTSCVEQVAVKSVVREATMNQGGCEKEIRQCIKKVSIEKERS